MHDVIEIFLRLFAELLFEPLVRLPGYVILLIFLPEKDVQIDGCLVGIVGAIFWLCTGLLVYWWWW